MNALSESGVFENFEQRIIHERDSELPIVVLGCKIISNCNVEFNAYSYKIAMYFRFHIDQMQILLFLEWFRSYKTLRIQMLHALQSISGNI